MSGSRDLTSLAARAEAGQGEDRRLDAEIALTIDADRWKPYVHSDGDAHIELPRWTSSLDATVALIAERLPGIGGNGWGVSLDPADGFTSYVTRNNVREGHWLVEVYGKSPARCLLSAFLKALAAQQQDRPTEG